MIQQVVRSFIDPALMSIIALRDQVRYLYQTSELFEPSKLSGLKSPNTCDSKDYFVLC